MYLQNRITNKPNLNMEVKDIGAYVKRKNQKYFDGKRETDPLNPQYSLQTRSRRHMLIFGNIEGSTVKNHISVSTKRRTNKVDDIPGAAVRDRGSIPEEIKMQIA